MARYLATYFGEARQREELVEPGAFVLLAERDGRIAAYAHLATRDVPPEVTGPAPVEIRRFYVHRDFFGQGLAQRLMTAALAEARARGARTAWLAVWQENPRAIAFYAKCGFERVGTTQFVLGDDVQDDFLLARPLDP